MDDSQVEPLPMPLSTVLNPSLAKKLARGNTDVADSLNSVPQFRQAKVISFNTNGTVNIAIDGQDSLLANNVRFMDTYFPRLNDAVWALSIGRGKWLIGGRIVPNPSTVEAWHEVGATNEPAFKNSNANYGAGYNTVAFCKTPDGWVHLKGLCTGGTVGNAIFTLPLGYRPATYHITPHITTDLIGRIDVVATDGNVFPQSPSTAGWYCLDGIQFRASDTVVSGVNTIGVYHTQEEWRRMPFFLQTGIDMYNDAAFCVPMAHMNEWGLVRTEGIYIDSSGASQQGLLIPFDMLPMYDANYIGLSNLGTTPVIASANFGVWKRVGFAATTWVSCSGFEWFNDQMNYQWTNITAFLNSWNYFSSGAGFKRRYPQYWKDPYGFVHLRGRIASGTLPGIAFTLPVGYRPALTSIHLINAADALCRVDITNTGSFSVSSGVNTDVRLDGINFRAV